MKLKQEEFKIVEKALLQWRKEGLLEPEKAQNLLNSIEKEKFDWQSLTLYSFLFAIISLSIATIALLADNWLMQLVDSLIETPHFLKSIVFTGISYWLIWLGLKRRRTQSAKVYSNEAFMFLGIVSIACSLSFMGLQFDNGSGHFGILILLATLIYGALGLMLQSQLIWLFALISLGAWFGTETGYITDWNDYFLGMNYPLRFALLGLIISAGSFLLYRNTKTKAFFGTTLHIGLLHFFISLWLLSIFGNLGDLDLWYEYSQLSMLGWSFLLLISSLLSIFLGLRWGNPTLKNYGIAFLFLNIYTRYFEFAWDSLHLALFFSIFGLSFWLIGKKAESIFNSGEKKHVDKKMNE